jgi:hypothetical protein
MASGLSLAIAALTSLTIVLTVAQILEARRKCLF